MTVEVGPEILKRKLHIVMDASKYDLFRLCECRYNYRYNFNLTPSVKSPQLDRGTLVHLGNEVYYEAISNGTKYGEAVVAALSKIREGGVCASDLDSDEITRIVDVMEEYYDFWRVEDQNLRIESVEQPFMYLLYEDDEVKFYMSGKIDLMFSDNKYTNVPMDHKSYDRASEVLRMSNQFKNYVTAVESNYLFVNRIGFQKTVKAHEKFKRVPLSYDKLILQDWKENVIKSMFHYVRCAAEESWPMNETSCDKYYRRCEYYDVCDSSGKEAKLYKLNNNFIKSEPWDVTKVLRKASQEFEDTKDAREKAHSSTETTEI